MTVTQHDEKQQANAYVRKDLTDLKFEPVLTVSEQVGDDNIAREVGKCSVDSSLGLLAVESKGKISCIDIEKKKEIFTETRDKTLTDNEMHSHRWIVIDGQKYFAIQWSQNTIRFFKIKQDDNSFTEAKKLRICLDEMDTITCCEFDETFENIIIVKNGETLEKRAIKNSDNVLISIKLETKIDSSFGTKILSLSNDGNWCIIGGGYEISYFYLIQIDTKIQYKLSSTNLDSTYSPCFVNGDPKFCVVGSRYGKFEIWDVKKRVSIKLLNLGTDEAVVSLTSTNNILAVGSGDQILSLF
eukprot:551587_1